MPLVIGTAGHIDHGKTSLIRALTGQDTDRLKEEKERGISIDLVPPARSASATCPRSRPLLRSGMSRAGLVVSCT